MAMKIEDFESVKSEYNFYESSKKWPSLFQDIREKCEIESKEKSFSVNEATKIENRQLNRYRDVNPYDHSRIVIHRGKVDYINANLVKCEKADRKYILTQGPLKDTVGHFWLMIWEQNTKAILMLNKIIEKSQTKCYMYWPDNIGAEHKLILQDVGLTVEFLKSEEYTNFCKRLFRLYDNESGKFRDVIQFHYITWPDFGIPSSPVAFLQFLKQVRDSGALDPEVGPAVVHCSAGIGRSGTFCLVDCCLVLIKKNGESNVSVREVLYELRRYRMGLIQTADQLYFSYQAIIEGIKMLDDPNFLELQEKPDISNKGNILDETPPPLPPARKESLHITTKLNRNSNVENNEENNRYLKEEISDPEKYVVTNHSISQRPLPPLPPLKRLAESDDSDDNSSCYEKSDNDEDYDGNDLNEDDNQNSIDKSKTSNDKIPEKNYQNINGVEMKGTEKTSDLRRRWPERQANIEKKVNEIKRKQKEADNESEASKKRRSFIKFITAGIIVGVICVYAYSKLT